MRLILERSGPAAALFLIALPVGAHHSRAIYDQERSITIEGIVTSYEWTNPHIYLYVEAQTESGEAVEWELEGNVTTIMRRRGWSRDTFAPGDRVTVQANPARDSSRATALLNSAEKAGIIHAGVGKASFNEAQLDSGQVASPSNPLGAGPDGIGDACQCGDLDATGNVGILDAVRLRANLLGAGSFDASRCGVYPGSPACDLVQSVVLRRGIAGQGPGVAQACTAAVGGQ